MSKINQTPDFKSLANDLKKNVVRYASVTGVNFFKDSFQNQGFTNDAFEPWQQRANDLDPGRKVLIKSAFLMNSIQVFDANEKRIVFGSDAEHAEIHNNGGTLKITLTPRARRYFWFMLKVTGNSMWKALALTKKETISINIPKRQFLGHSNTLLNQLDNWVLNEIEKRFKQL